MNMPILERVTVTLSSDLIRDIDRQEKNRSKFVSDAIVHELDRRRRTQLHVSLENPHPESAELAERGLDDWAAGLPDEDAEALLSTEAGQAVGWIPGRGWVELPD